MHFVWKAERKRSSTHWLTLQMPILAMTGQGRSQEPGIQCGSPTVAGRDPSAWASSCCFPGYTLAGNWIWEQKLRHKTRHCNKTCGCSKRCLNHCAKCTFLQSFLKMLTSKHDHPQTGQGAWRNTDSSQCGPSTGIQGPSPHCFFSGTWAWNFLWAVTSWKGLAQFLFCDSGECIFMGYFVRVYFVVGL